MKAVVFFFSFFLAFLSFSEENIDSLKGVWNNENLPDTVRLEAVHSLIWGVYLQTKLDSAISYANEEYDFADARGLISWKANARNSLGSAYRVKGEFLKAIEAFEQCIELNDEAGEELSKASALGNLGILYLSQAEYANALKNFIYCKKVYEKAGRTSSMLNAINYIGGVYLLQGNFKLANQNLREGLQIAIEKEDGFMEAYFYGNIGLMFQEQGDLDSALYYHGLGLELDLKNENKAAVINTKLNLAALYLTLKNYDKAEGFYNECLESYTEVGEQKGIALALTNLGSIQYEKGNYQKAIELGEKALLIAEEVGAVPELKNVSNHLYLSYKKVNNQPKALKMYELFVEMKDSLDSQEQKQETLRQGFQYKYDRKTMADSLVNLEKDKIQEANLEVEKEKTQKEKQKAYFLIIGILIVTGFGIFIYSRFKVIKKQKNIIQQQKIEVDKQKEEAEFQKEIVEEKNKEIVDSINYAKRLQGAILPSNQDLENHLRDYFLLYKPKDIVAGDFYWLENYKGWTYIAVADSTGHGVPGALVSVVCSNALTKSLLEEGIDDPAAILDRTRELVIDSFNTEDQSLRDGMDISLAKINFKTKEMIWAGANNDIWICRDNVDHVEVGGDNPIINKISFAEYNTNLIEIKADKQPIGKYEKAEKFRSNSIKLEAKDQIYMFTDGFADQFGGEVPEYSKKGGKKLKTKNLKTWIAKNSNLGLKHQKERLETDFDLWKGDLEQIDDVCILGVKV